MRGADMAAEREGQVCTATTTTTTGEAASFRDYADNPPIQPIGICVSLE